MPSTIPYDPSLVLGNIVPQEKLDRLLQMSELQAAADAAEDELNSLITMRRSIDMTVHELINMRIDVKELVDKRNEIDENIAKSARDFAKEKLAAEKAIQPIKATMRSISENIESPMDYYRTGIKKMPLSFDSLKMNVQYFSLNENKEDSSTHAAQISAFVSGQVSYLGNDFMNQATSSSSAQVNSQLSQHSITGTLVFSVTCTHKDAVLLAPFYLDVDKAIRVWNQVFRAEMIKTDNVANVMEIAAQASTADEKSLTILSGATYGSCFIGMVHILNTTKTSSSETMMSIANKMQNQFKIGGWFADASGGFGVNSSFSNDAKNLLSTQNITSHCSIVSVGSIPSIKSNEIAGAVKGFTDFDAAKTMEKLATLQNATASAQDSVDASAKAARTGQQLLEMKNHTIKGTLSGLADIDAQKNKIIDVNSVVDALDDYIQKCLQGNIGVPINFYIKPITRSQLAQMWMAKYFPGKYLAISGDDSGKDTSNSTSGTSGSSTP